MRLVRTNSVSASPGVGVAARETWTTGLPWFRASETVFFDPPESVGPMEKTTVLSLSRAFHSVRWIYLLLGGANPSRSTF